MATTSADTDTPAAAGNAAAATSPGGRTGRTAAQPLLSSFRDREDAAGTGSADASAPAAPAPAGTGAAAGTGTGTGAGAGQPSTPEGRSGQTLAKRDSDHSLWRGVSSDFLAPVQRLPTNATGGALVDYAPIPENDNVPPPTNYGARRIRTWGFLLLHLASFFTMLAVMVNFYETQDYRALLGLSILFFFSGCFCAHAAYHSEAPEWAPRLLPLKKHCFLVGLFLMIPFGLLQGIVIVLALEDYTTRGTEGGRARQEERANTGSRRAVVNKFHCKAVIGIFEGLFSAGISFYAYWTMGYPEGDPITQIKWNGEREFLIGVCWVLAVSAGLGLLELDFCVSREVAKLMHKSMLHEILHIIFRTCECMIRMCLYVWITVTFRQTGLKYTIWVSISPMAIDCIVTALLVVMFGGAEPNYFVRVLCTGPCVFANIFLFIDSPYKRRAANRLSFWLFVRNVVSMIAVPLLGQFWQNSDESLGTEWQGHGYMIAIATCMVPIYLILGWFLAVRKEGTFSLDIPDIYTACLNGDLVEIERCIMKLTRSACVGLNVNIPDVDGFTMLMLAAQRGHEEACRLLIEKGADPSLEICCDDALRRFFSRAKKRAWTAVHMAACRGHSEVLEVLVGAEPDNRDWQDLRGDTPLHVAVAFGREEAASVLAARRPEWLDVNNKRNQTPLHLARTEDFHNMLESSAANGSRVITTRSGRRPSEASSFRNRLVVPTTGASSATPLSQTPEEQRRQQQQRQRQDSGAAGVEGDGEGGEGDSASRSQPEDWAAVELKITKASISEVEQIAPGLCSYIASSCGGALGRLFLKDAKQPEFVESNSALGNSVISVGHAAHSAVVDHEGIYSYFASADESPKIEEMEPVDENGATSEAWREAVKKRQSSGGPMYAGLTVQNIKREAPDAVLGEGTYGIVWRAANTRDRSLWYAVKTIKTWQGTAPPQATRECEVADKILQIPHPCIVKLHHVCNFSDVGIYALVMEFALNGDLMGQLKDQKKRCLNEGRPYSPPALAKNWIAQVFLGLEHMHRRMDTLLRDLKPDNVVLDRHFIAKLTDFGFGRFGCESKTGTWSFGVPTGSPGYVAPEILHGRRYNFAADLYSFGVLVWVLLTGGLVDQPTWVCTRNHHITQQQRNAAIARAQEKYYNTGGSVVTGSTVAGSEMSGRPSAATTPAPPSPSTTSTAAAGSAAAAAPTPASTVPLEVECPECMRRKWTGSTLTLCAPPPPRPPVGAFRRRADGSMDYTGFFNDCRSLRLCLEEPERYHARRLNENPKNFVAKLTSENPKSRLDHQKIRGHPFFQSMNLPAYHAPPRAVKAYINAMIRAQSRDTLAGASSDPHLAAHGSGADGPLRAG